MDYEAADCDQERKKKKIREKVIAVFFSQDSFKAIFLSFFLPSFLSYLSYLSTLSIYPCIVSVLKGFAHLLKPVIVILAKKSCKKMIFLLLLRCWLID
jgi:hypothetical protein